jgi:hypothetical protein
MAVMEVVAYGEDPTTGLKGPAVPILVTSAAAPPSQASSVKITDGTTTVGINSNSFSGNSLEVSSGFVLGGVTINGASSNINGAAVDGGSARSNWTAFCFPTGTLTGNLSMELSDDGGNWVPSGTTVTGFPVAVNLGMFSTGRAARYARVNLTGSSGVGTITIRMMASG